MKNFLTTIFIILSFPIFSFSQMDIEKIDDIFITEDAVLDSLIINPIDPLQKVPLPKKSLADCLLPDNGVFNSYYSQPPYKDWKFNDYNEALRNIMSAYPKHQEKGLKTMSKLRNCKFWGVSNAANYQMLLHHYTGEIDQYFRPNPAGYEVREDRSLYAAPSVKILGLSKIPHDKFIYSDNHYYTGEKDTHPISEFSLPPKVRNILRVFRGQPFFGDDILWFEPELLEALGYELCIRTITQKTKIDAPNIVELIVNQGTNLYMAEQKASIPLKVERLSVLYPYINNMNHANQAPDIGLTASELISEGKKWEAQKTNLSQPDKNIIRAIFYYTRAALYGSFDGFQNLVRIYCDTFSPTPDKDLREAVADLAVLRELCPTLKKVNSFKDFTYLLEPVECEINETYKRYDEAYTQQKNEEFWENYRKEQEKKERRNRFWKGMAQAAFNALGQTANMLTYQRNAISNSSAAIQMPQFSNFGSNPTSGNLNYLLDPRFAIAQVQAQELQDYQRTREAYQRMGRDLTLTEFRVLQGQAIMDMKEQGYDITAEQKAINDDLHNFNRSQMNSGKENVERIKKQNAKNRTSSEYNKTTNSSNSTSSKKIDRNTAQKTSSSTTSNTSSRSDTPSNKTSATEYNAHEQYKAGHLNTQTNSYGDKIKNVSMSVKDGSSYRNVNLHGELYKKDGKYYVKIGNSFFKVENSGGSYNSYIIYGSKAHYFNK